MDCLPGLAVSTVIRKGYALTPALGMLPATEACGDCARSWTDCNGERGSLGMCELLAAQDPEYYASRTRSVRIGGVVRSIQLENGFWSLLGRIAAEQNMSVPELVTTLWEEMCELEGEPRNFTSALRCSCLIYLNARPADRRRGQQPELT